MLITLKHITRTYESGALSAPALRDVNFEIASGERCAITGPSGSGKSTLLNILGLLDRPESGEFYLDGQDVLRASDDELAFMRNRKIGFVFQSFNLLPRLSAADNVAMPLIYRGTSRVDARSYALDYLTRVGLADRAEHRPAELSGGQKQRVAIARALVGKPSIILADEPTGNLDPVSAEEVISLFLSMNEMEGTTLIVVTHDATLANRLDRRIAVHGGCLTEHTLTNLN